MPFQGRTGLSQVDRQGQVCPEWQQLSTGHLLCPLHRGASWGRRLVETGLPQVGKGVPPTAVNDLNLVGDADVRCPGSLGQRAGRGQEARKAGWTDEGQACRQEPPQLSAGTRHGVQRVGKRAGRAGHVSNAIGTSWSLWTAAIHPEILQGARGSERPPGAGEASLDPSHCP